MLKLEPYLIFKDNCEDAFNFYKSVFGGELEGRLMRYKDIPDGSMNVSEEFKDKVLHVSLPVGNDVILMGSDAGPEADKINVGNNVVLTLSLDDEAEARRIFKELSEGGNIIMPLEKTFWAKLYGMFTDKFGINWNINYGYE